MFFSSINKHRMCKIILDKINAKQTRKKIDKIEQNLKWLVREITFFAADSKSQKWTNTNNLLGGVMIVLRAKARILLLEDRIAQK